MMVNSIFRSCLYILENKDAHRVKVGATFNHPDDRLLDVTRKWSGVSARCQICLNWRLVKPDGHMPSHVLSGNYCAGSNKLPFEKDVSLAELELINLQEQVEKLHGSQKTSVIRRINNLRKVIDSYINTPRQIGSWQLLASYSLEDAYQVEATAHQILLTHLDKDSPIGEVFNCLPEVAIAAVEAAIAKFHKRDFEESD
jgi:hypothetical protein